MKTKGNRNFTKSERKTIEKMLGEGSPVSRIATFLGRSHSGLASEINRTGGRTVYTEELGTQIAEKLATRSLERIKPFFTEDECKLIKQYFVGGMSTNALKDLFQTTRYTINRVLNGTFDKVNSPKRMFLEDRISALEQQIEIILDIIKEKL